MLKYDYHAVIKALTSKCAEAVELACRRQAAGTKRITELCGECNRVLCELEAALFAEFLPPLDRSGIAAYAHAICAVSDCALVYAKSSPIQYTTSVPQGFDGACISLCEMLCESAAMLEKIKKSSDIPRLEEFRDKKSTALESVCDRTRAPQLFVAREQLLFAISDAFDVLVGLILKSI